MSVIDILTRVDAICKKYDKYDIEKQKDSNVSGEDAFARLYAVVEADIEAAEQVVFVNPLVSVPLFASTTMGRLNCWLDSYEISVL